MDKLLHINDFYQNPELFVDKLNARFEALEPRVLPANGELSEKGLEAAYSAVDKLYPDCPPDYTEQWIKAAIKAYLPFHVTDTNVGEKPQAQELVELANTLNAAYAYIEIYGRGEADDHNDILTRVDKQIIALAQHKKGG